MIETRVTVSTEIPVNLTGKNAPKLIRESSRAGAEFHHDRHVPKLFKPGAATRHGFERRTARYQRLKKRLGLSSLPLVFSGRTRDEVTGSRKITATSTKGARLTMRASFPGISKNFRFKVGQDRLTDNQARQLKRVKELESITSDELAAVARAEERKFEELINSTAMDRRRT